MTKKTYKGLCIGGPKAGQWIENYSPFVEFSGFPKKLSELSRDPNPPETPQTYNVDKYRFIDNFSQSTGGGQINAWMHHSIRTLEQAYEEVLHYYAKGRFCIITPRDVVNHARTNKQAKASNVQGWQGR